MMQACPGNSTTLLRNGSSDLQDCVCGAGFYYDTDNTFCALCPSGFYCDGLGNTTSCPNTYHTTTKGASHTSDCFCIEGFYANPSCIQCPIGFYCPRNSTVPLACPENKTTLTFGQHDITHCFCQEGFFKNAHSGCEQCTVGSFCTGDGIRQMCPSNTTSPRGSTNSTDCVCQAGFYLHANECSPCPEGSFCLGSDYPPSACDESILCVNHTTYRQECSSVENYKCVACENIPENAVSVFSNTSECTWECESGFFMQNDTVEYTQQQHMLGEFFFSRRVMIHIDSA